jgi:tetratricopeptide (TPR) repeat protein
VPYGAVAAGANGMTGGPDAPYPGDRPFHLADHHRFFGRAAEAADLAQLWKTNHLTIAVGPTASGKTSLLHAGVLPLVANTGLELLPPGRICYGSTFPLAVLAEHNPYTAALLRSWSPGEIATRLVGLSVRDFVGRRGERCEGPILAAIDQVEELFADSGPRLAHRRRFLAELAEAVRPESRLHLLVLVREEAMGQVIDGLGGGARCSVTALTPPAAIAAVTGPAAGAGRTFAAGAAENLVADLRTSRITGAGGVAQDVTADHVQPSLLQVVCSSLWNSLPADVNPITTRDVHRYGNADVALASYCGQVIAAVAEDHDLPAAKLRAWLHSTFITGLGTRGNAYEGPAGTQGMPNAVVRALEDRHLLRAELRSGSRWYELLSDRLIEPLRQVADERPPPVKPAEYLQAAERALALGDLNLAERYAEEALRTSAGADQHLRAQAHSLLGDLAYEREIWKEAEARYREAAGLFEAARDTAAAALQLAAVGHTLLAQGRLADAVAELNAAVGRMPNDPVLQTGLSLALWRRGEGDGAVAILNGLLGIDSGNIEALRVRGEILADLGYGRDAMRDLDRVTLQDRPSSRAARGLALAKLGDQAAASREIKDALEEAPRNGPVLLYSARATALGGDLNMAEDLARRAIDAMDPALPPQQLQAALQLAERKSRGK